MKENQAAIIDGGEPGKCETCRGGERKTLRGEQLKRKLYQRLNRIEGQVRGIKGMIEKDAYCDDILHQISAVRAALTSVSKLALEHHICHCFADKVRAGDQTIVEEFLLTIGKML